MPEDLWRRVDDVISAALVPTDEALDAALEASAAAGLPPISVAPNQGRMLALLVRLTRARRVLEIGTLGGYSTIWMARALPEEGRLVTLEVDPRHAEVATVNLARAGVTDRVEVVVGAALDTLGRVEADHGRTFSMAFIDADKERNADYFTWALRLVEPGGLIVVDNVIRNGAIVDPSSDDSRVQGVLRLFDVMAASDAVEATAVQTVGAKGYDGFAMAWVAGG